MQRPVHICFLQDSLYSPSKRGWTGTHLQNYNLARQFRQAGLQVSFVVASAAAFETVPEGYEGMSVHFVRTAEIAPFLFFWREVKQALHRLSPDFVYVKGRSWLAGVASSYTQARGAKLIWASNNEDGCCHWKFARKTLTSSKSFPRKLAKLSVSVTEDVIYARAINRADFCINQSRRQQEQLYRCFRRNGIVIPSLQEIPRGPFLKQSPPLVIWIGYFAREKAPQWFLKLAASFCDAPFKFCMVGASSPNLRLSEELAQAKNNPNFQYLGERSRSEVLQLLERASLLVNTSTPDGDGIPNAMIEAWLREVPVVSYEFDPDGLIRREQMGVVAGANWQEFVQAFKRLLDHHEQRKALSRHVRLRAIDLFSPDKIIAQYLQLLKIESIESRAYNLVTASRLE